MDFVLGALGEGGTYTRLTGQGLTDLAVLVLRLTLLAVYFLRFVFKTSPVCLIYSSFRRHRPHSINLSLELCWLAG